MAARVLDVHHQPSAVAASDDQPTVDALKLTSASTSERTSGLTSERTSALTSELAWKSVVGASADVCSVVDAFAVDEPFSTGSAGLLKLWDGEISAVDSEEPSPLCVASIAVVAFAVAAFDVERPGVLEDVAATCVGAASAEAAFAGGAFAEETFAEGSSEPSRCAVQGVEVVALVWAVAVVGASVVVGASFVVAASGVGPYGVVACVEEHVVGVYVVGAYVAGASAVAESVAEEVLEASLEDSGDLEASQVGKTYLDQLELASSFVEGPSEVLFGPWACPDALHQEILDSYAVGVR